MINDLFPETLSAKPFLKWAGGKSQLIPAIEASLPKGLLNKKNLTYIEPFVGSGAIMFWFIQKFPKVQTVVINDINSDLTKAYSIIKEQPYDLIEILKNIQHQYYQLPFEQDKLALFLEKRIEFNARNSTDLYNTALLIFLNRTCFNGLYRVNSKNQFNVPFGRYSKPKICDEKTILGVSNILQKVLILNGDYQSTLNYVSENTFFYFDPPYKPISKTSSFNSYAKDSFDDNEQIRLKLFCDEITAGGHKWLLSNSDPKNTNIEDNFFDDLYSNEVNSIKRVRAKRMINSNSEKRGEINEILISNYKP